MFPRRVNTLLLAGLVAAATLTACSGGAAGQSGSEAPASDGGGTSDSAAGPGGDTTVVMAVNALPEHLTTSPWGGVASHTVFTGLGAQLVGYDRSGLPGNGCEQLATGEQIVPRLAESVELSEDGSKVTVTLRELVSPSGNTLSAEDVKWSLEHGNQHQPVGASSLTRAGFDLEADDFATVVDERTIELKVAEATSMTIEVLQNNLYNIMDSTQAQAEGGDDPLALDFLNTTLADYSGWELENFTPGTSVTLQANPDWGGERGNVDRLQIQAVPETSTRLQLMTTGEADMATGFEYDEWRTLADTPGVTVSECQSITRDTMMFRTDDGPLADQRVRQAISLAIDREALVTGAYNGFGTAARSSYPSAFNLPETDAWYSHDQQAALDLLAEAGHEDGFSFELTYTPTRPGPVAGRTAVLIQTMLGDIGIDVELREIINPSEAQAEIQQKGNYEALLWSEPGAVSDPGHWGAIFLTSEAPSNTTAWASPDYDAMMDELQVTPLSETDRRRELMTDLSTIVDTEMPILYLVEVPNLYAFSDRVEPAVPNINGQVQFNDITVKQ